jgi:hypothetical protein
MEMPDDVMRTIIEIQDETIANADYLGERQKMSRAAMISEAVNQYLEDRGSPLVEAAFGKSGDQNRTPWRNLGQISMKSV